MSILNFLLYLDNPDMLSSYFRLVKLYNQFHIKKKCFTSLSVDSFKLSPFDIVAGCSILCKEAFLNFLAENIESYS